jgi:hypothetical protein
MSTGGIGYGERFCEGRCSLHACRKFAEIVERDACEGVSSPAHLEHSVSDKRVGAPSGSMSQAPNNTSADPFHLNRSAPVSAGRQSPLTLPVREAPEWLPRGRSCIQPQCSLETRFFQNPPRRMRNGETAKRRVGIRLTSFVNQLLRIELIDNGSIASRLRPGDRSKHKQAHNEGD